MVPQDGRAPVLQHYRSYRGLHSGRTQVTIKLDQAVVCRGLVLAEVEPPLCAIQGNPTLECKYDESVGARDANAEFEGKLELPVELQRTAAGGFRYVLNQDAPNSMRRDWVWQYELAAGLELAGKALSFCPQDENGLLTVCDHVLQIQCEFLELEVELASKLGAKPAASISEREIGGGWRAIESSAPSCQVLMQRKIHWPVKDPELGRRYRIRYRFQEQQDLSSADSCRVSDELLRVCRSARATGAQALQSLRAALNHAINVGLSEGEICDDVLQVLGPKATWQVLLWHDRSQQLLACFGEFPNEHWALAFARGQAVAGHCFRTGEPAGYARGSSAAVCAYASHLSGGVQYGEEPHWVFCMPIKFGVTGHSIGVLMFTGEDVDLAGAVRLEELAREYAPLGQVEGRDPHGLIEQLKWLVPGNFWTAVGQMKMLENSVWRAARKVGAEFMNLSRPLPSATGIRLNPGPSAPSQDLDTTLPGTKEASDPTISAAHIQAAASNKAALLKLAGVITVALLGLIGTLLVSKRGGTDNIAEATPPPKDVGSLKPDPCVTQLEAARRLGIRPDFHDRDLSTCPLAGRRLEGANLSGALLPTLLTGCNLSFADVRRADFRSSDVANSKFDGACYDANTRFPIGFDPPAHGLVEAVTLLSPTPGFVRKGLVSVKWGPPVPMVVSWVDAEGLCRSNANCDLNTSVATSPPVQLEIDTDKATIEIRRWKAPFAEATVELQLR